MFSDKVLKTLSISDREIVFDFFVFYSRLEYALKKTPQFRKDEGYVEADWSEFKKSIKPIFDASKNKKLKKAADYLTDKPPRKIEETSDGLEFRDASFTEENSPENLIDIICVVRNNLFHGGKYVKEEVSDLARDEDLLENSLIILEEFVNSVKPVKEAFYNV
ncbi:hypothetical protein [Fodinibius salsisoli]|uniref:MAE-28990/MAE-18760-like HEPN domain-containing protein n=1 Tax=Fodinibius salsisoli TaxID=2820877 RepID=A0ABT3PQ21_9BACT|nr:hypothetical protein [Fodinibius salsisoli]MCW9707931.1 hypothetical protein [Fodinibius salsisoli]